MKFLTRRRRQRLRSGVHGQARNRWQLL